MRAVQTARNAPIDYRALAFRVAETLEHIVEKMEEGLEADLYQRLRGQATVDVNGIATITFTPPPGTAWELVTLATTGTASGSLGVYLDEVTGMNLIYADTSDTLLSDNFGAGEYVGQNQTLIVRFGSQTVGSVCTVAMRAKRLSANAPFMMEHAAAGEVGE